MKVKFTLSIGFAAAQHTEIVEFEDGIKDSDIEAEYRDWCNNYLDGGWSVIEDGQEDDE